MDCSGWEDNFEHNTPFNFITIPSEQVILIKVDGEYACLQYVYTLNM